MSITLGSSGAPMFPPIWTVWPWALSISAIRVVVVVFPSDPVTPMSFAGHKSKKTSISEVTVTPFARYSASCGSV